MNPDDRATRPLDHPADDPGRPVLSGTSVELRSIDPEADADDLFPDVAGSAPGDAVWRYLTYGPFTDRDALAAWLTSRAQLDDPRSIAVVERATGRAVGVVALMALRPAMRVLEIGHVWYVPRVHRTRVNTETIYLLLRFAFETLGYRRVEWKTDDQNARSRSAALRLGFVFEGIFRQHMIVKGRSRDTAWFAMLDGDWPRIRGAFEHYLSSPDGSAPLHVATTAADSATAADQPAGNHNAECGSTTSAGPEKPSPEDNDPVR